VAAAQANRGKAIHEVLQAKGVKALMSARIIPLLAIEVYNASIMFLN
jgi:mannitol-specific phosphotransferase system IIBC component